MANTVPPIQFTPEGLVIPTEDAVLAAVQVDIDTAFGGGTDPNLDTPQGQMASSQSAIVSDKNAEILTLSNQVDPQYSDGRFQDGIGRIYFLTRKPALATAVTCTLTGVPGTIVPAGTLAQDINGNTYIADASATIGITGTVSSVFSNIVTGPIPCAATTLTQIYQALVGWDAITNPAPGTTGANVESRAQFEYRRKNSVAINAHGTVNAIYGEVFAILNVIDVYVIDNPTNATVMVGATNFPVVAHSVFVAAVGATDQEVGEAIWRKKDVGCDYNGNTTVAVVDTSGYSYPQPEYNVTFERPTALPLFFAVSLINDPTLPFNISDLVKQAVLDRFNGNDGTSRERIGSLILASRYYGAVVSIASSVALISVLIGTSGPALLTQINVGIDQRPTLDSANITVILV